MNVPEFERWHVLINFPLGCEHAIATDQTAAWLDEQIVQPYCRDAPAYLGGHVVRWADISRIRIASSTVPFSSLLERVAQEDAYGRAALGSAEQKESCAIDLAVDRTDQVLIRSVRQAATDQRAKSADDRRSVMVIHGRNEVARRELFNFLRAINLRPKEWSSFVELAGSHSPYTGDVLDTAFSVAQAVVVLLTPDDVGQLIPPLRDVLEYAYETELSGQARSNVLFEAGMALGRHPNRTVLVDLGTTRPIGYLSGRAVRLNGHPGPFREIAQRLQTAGCDVMPDGDEWQYACNYPGLDPASLPSARDPPRRRRRGFRKHF